MECYSILQKSTGISIEIRRTVFKKLTREVLCDIPKIPRERQTMCPRGLDIPRRASLNVQRALFSVLCWHFTEPSPVN